MVVDLVEYVPAQAAQVVTFRTLPAVHVESGMGSGTNTNESGTRFVVSDSALPSFSGIS